MQPDPWLSRLLVPIIVPISFFGLFVMRLFHLLNTTMNSSVSLLYLCQLALLALARATGFEQKCLQFQPESAAVDGFHLTTREYLAVNTTVDIPNNDPSCNIRQQKVAASLCRVAGHVKTSEVSGISLELWLPEQWTGRRVLSTGNGGVDGCKYQFNP